MIDQNTALWAFAAVLIAVIFWSDGRAFLAKRKLKNARQETRGNATNSLSLCLASILAGVGALWAMINGQEDRMIMFFIASTILLAAYFICDTIENGFWMQKKEAGPEIDIANEVRRMIEEQKAADHRSYTTRPQGRHERQKP